MMFRTCKLVTILALLAAPCARSQVAMHAHSQTMSSAEKRLVGAWSSRPQGGGKRVVYLRDGTGKNYDGSRFTWHLERDYLVGQALTADGKPTGESAKTPILFTKDGKEYATFLEAGRLKTPFYRLLPNGRVDRHRTKSGGIYPPNRFLPKQSDEDESAPATHPEKPPQQSSYHKPATQCGGVDTDASAATPIRVRPNVQVSTGWPRVPHAEVTIAADRRHAGWLLAASMFSPPPFDAAAPKVVVYASRDGGKTWSVSLERKNPNPQTYADPAFACAGDGSIFFVDMYWPAMDARKGMALQLTRTADGGGTWRPSTTIAGLHDRPFLAADTGGSARNGWLYCTAGFPDKSVFVSRDGGKSFLPGVSWSNRTDGTVLMGNPVVTSDGTLALLYCATPGADTVRPPSSADAVRAAAPPVETDQLRPGYVPPKPLPPTAVKIVRSLDGGATFLEPQQIGRDENGQSRGGLPMLSIDPGSHEYKDRLYAVWVDTRATGSRVMLASSSDGGAAWSRPIVLSEQREQSVSAASGTTGITTEAKSYSAYLPCVAVNKAGVVGVSWYDTRGLPEAQAGWNLRFRASVDGGATWLPSVRVTSASTLYTRERRKRFPTETRSNYFQPGHTAGLAADSNGVFHPLWIDGRTGVRQVFTATVTIEAPALQSTR